MGIFAFCQRGVLSADWKRNSDSLSHCGGFNSIRLSSGYGRNRRCKKTQVCAVFAVVLLVGSLAVLKYVNFGINTVNGIAVLWGKGGIL